MSAQPSNPPTWDIQNTHFELVEPLKEVLREVVDPELGMNVIQLGLIRNVTMHPDYA